MPPRRVQIALAISVLLAATALASARVALAVFTHSAGGGPLTVATSTLYSPKSPTASQVNCRSNKTPEIEVAWSATSSNYATSYTIERATASAGLYNSVGSVAIGETAYTDKSGSLASSTTYYYRISAVYRSWSATSSTASVRTLSKFCLSS